MKKRILRILPLLLIPFLFTSCIDYVQAYSYSDGEYKVYFKVTLNKTIYTLADQDPEKELNDIDAIKEVCPPNVVINQVNNTLDAGAEFMMSIDPRTRDETEKSFLPTKSGNKVYIPFIFST